MKRQLLFSSKFLSIFNFLWPKLWVTMLQRT